VFFADPSVERSFYRKLASELDAFDVETSAFHRLRKLALQSHESQRALLLLL
jgi:hypothetical protein